LRIIAKHRVWWWSAEDREDVIQSTLTVFLEKIHEVRDNPGAFVVQVLSYQIGNELRRKRVHTGFSLDQDSRMNDSASNSSRLPEHSAELTSDANADRGVEKREEMLLVARAIDNLKPFCRAVFKAMIEDFTVGEIWDSVRQTESGLTRSAFDKRVFECRRKLKQMVGRSL
jgi:DNA-directed RNA polymerase specialized sigma24 family protein